MGAAATANRKKLIEKAMAVEAKTVECIDAVNRQNAQITRLHERTHALEQARTEVDTRFGAQGKMILSLEDRLDAIDKRLDAAGEDVERLRDATHGGR